jgi:uncharacterized membrane protein YgaE (UPF0421/DUF939 family)
MKDKFLLFLGPLLIVLGVGVMFYFSFIFVPSSQDIDKAQNQINEMNKILECK